MATDWSQPSEVTDLDIAFAARGVELTPDRSEVPDEFRDRSNLWNAFVSRWFYKGDPFEIYELFSKPDVDGDLAIRHITVVLKCFGTKHEDKMAGAAYLLSLWFEGIREKVF